MRLLKICLSHELLLWHSVKVQPPKLNAMHAWRRIRQSGTAHLHEAVNMQHHNYMKVFVASEKQSNVLDAPWAQNH